MAFIKEYSLYVLIFIFLFSLVRENGGDCCLVKRGNGSMEVRFLRPNMCFSFLTKNSAFQFARIEMSFRLYGTWVEFDSLLAYCAIRRF